MPSAFVRSAHFHPADPEWGRSVPSAGHRPPYAVRAQNSLGLILLIAIVSMFAASCHRHRQVRVFVPPPVTRRPFVLPPAPEIPDAPEIELAPDAEGVPTLIADIPVLAPPPEPPKRPVVVAAPKPAPPPPAPEPEPPSSPRLGQIFTADQLRDYNRTLDDSMTRARTVLAVAAGRRLNAQQSEMVVRIRTFMMQAELARQKDLVTAVNLARRADLLARDLSGSLP
jgi:hypothetical protein